MIADEVTTGKSTTLRYASSKLHPSRYLIILVVSSPASILEVLRQISVALDMKSSAKSIASLTHVIKSLILEISHREQIPVLVIEEANLYY